MGEKAATFEELVARARRLFLDEFQAEPQVAASAPGRVNLIGDHVDYNDGFVLPMALPMLTVVVGRKIQGDQSTVVTGNDDVDFPRRTTIEMPSKNALIRACQRGSPKWADYVKGVIVNYIGDTPAFEAVIVSSVPIGGGLSSSASLEVATYTFLDALNEPNAVMPTDKALACQKAEHDYAGMPCGIMDQFVSFMGREGHALLIDCRNLTCSPIPLTEPTVSVLLINSRVRHELTGSEYPTRRKQCQQAALILKKLSLRDATAEDIEYLRSLNTDEEIVKRAKHVVSEIDRTIRAADALKESNYKKFGQLMTESHRSLRDDFETSCPEIDDLVEATLQAEGVLGSRITGGGFGGCTVSLVYTHLVDKVIDHVKHNFNGKPTFYVCKPCQGAQYTRL